MAKYCYCCKAKVDHCFCSFHTDEHGCGMCMKHNVAVVEQKTELANGDTVVRKVREHVCPA